MMSALLALHTTIRDIDERQWDELAGDNAFATKGWLLTIEDTWLAKASPIYFTYSTAGCLTAAAVSYIVESSPPYETLDDVVYGRFRPVACALGASFLPALVCGPAVGYGWHVGLRRDTSAGEAERVMGSLVEALEEEADRRRLRLHFAHVSDTQGALRRVLHARGYLRSRSVPVGKLEIKWATFDDYLDSFPGKTRNEMRREMRRNRDAGTRIEFIDGNDLRGAPLVGLISENARRHRGPAFPFGPRFLDTLRPNLGDRVWVLTARKHDRTTAACVVLQQERTAFAVAVGVDPALAADDYTYFQITYYSTIEQAIRSGISHIYFGRGAYDAKVRRGCSLSDTWLYSRVRGTPRLAVGGWYRLSSAWNHRKLPAHVRKALA